VQRVLDAQLALLQLGFGGRADLDQRDAPRELCDPLVQRLAVVVGVGGLALAAIPAATRL
jgi:hypothetical protein